MFRQPSVLFYGSKQYDDSKISRNNHGSIAKSFRLDDWKNLKEIFVMVNQGITVDMSSFKIEDMSLAVGKDGTELDFKTAFSFYMDDAGVTVGELSERTGIARRTIHRYRQNNVNMDIKTIVVLCIGMKLSVRRSMHLINLAGLSFTQSAEHRLYYSLISIAYCSDLTVEKCSNFLKSKGYEPLFV